MEMFQFEGNNCIFLTSWSNDVIVIRSKKSQLKKLTN